MNPSTSNNLGINYISQDQLQQPQQSQPASSGNSGNWFTHLLPTIGSVGGTILGGIATGGLGGEFVGGAGGSALGQALENALEGKQALQGNDLTAGIEGGVGSLIGGVAGKALGKAGELLGSHADKLVADAATSAADKTALQAVQDTRNNFGNAGDTFFRQANNLEGNQKLLKEWGYNPSKPTDMQKASDAGLFIHNIDQQALGAGSPIKTTEVVSSNNVVNMTPEEQQAAMRAGIIGNTGKVADTITPLQADSFASDLNSQLRTAKGIMDRAAGGTNIDEFNAAKTNYNNLLSQYNKVKDAASTPEVNAAIAARTVTPEEKQVLIEKFGPKPADYIEQKINNAQSHADLVKAKLPFAQMNDLSKVAQRAAKDSASASNLARAKADLAPEPNANVQPTAGQAATNLALTAANPHASLLSKAVSGAGHVANNPKLLDVMSRIAALGDKLGTVGDKAIPGVAPILGAAIGAGNSQLAPAAPGMQNANGIMGGSMQPTASNIPVTPQTDASGLNRNDLLTLALYSPSAFNALVTPSATQQQNVVNANTAEQSLSNLGSMNTPSMGIVSSLAGRLGLGSAGAYERQAQQAAQEIAAAIPGSDQHAITAELTNYMAGGASIQDAIRSLMANLNAVKQGNTNAPYQTLMNFHPAGQPTL